MEFFSHVTDEQFKSAKLQEINDWLEAGDPGRMTAAELVAAWVEHDHPDIAKHLRSVQINKGHLYRLMLVGDRVRRFGMLLSGDDAPGGGTRFSEFAKSQPLGAKWGYAEFTGWMIEMYPAEVEAWLEADALEAHDG